MLDAPTCLRSGFILSLSFLLIFTAYSATEVLETSIIPSHCSGCDEGPTTGTCQYGTVCQEKQQFACDVACTAPFRECKSPLGGVVMGTMYLTFMTSAMAGPFLPPSSAVFALANLVVALNPTNVVLQWGIMLPTAVLGGVAASFLWISQASYLTRLSVLYSQFKRVPAIASVGLFNGIFLSLFWIYTATSVAGTALLCLIPDLPLQAAAPLPTEYTKLLEPDSAVATMRSLAALAMDRCIYPFIRPSCLVQSPQYIHRRMLALTPIMLLNGLQQGFLSGEFTSNVVRESLGSAAIGTVFAVVGLVSVSSSFVFGKLADKYNLLMEITWVDDFTTDLAPCPGNS
ncbi:hypothetical protein DYB26_014503 [Aphanomyces astaci]|uniref:Uncharacterized protein n=2 Tax=Aphanomyces astaci TaxID=112090 RepID=A0A3R6XZG0_APHAT|nr:hypothetical protein DYB26_014503 [Aphanomyces astaci]